MIKMLKSTESAVGKITRTAAGTCLFIVFVLFMINICLRFIPVINLKWIDETIQFFLVWTIFLSAMEAVRTGQHFMVDIVTDKLKGRLLGGIFRLLAAIISLFTFALICWFGFDLCGRSTSSMVVLTFMKQSHFYLCIPLSAVFMCVYAFRDLVLAAADLFSGRYARP